MHSLVLPIAVQLCLMFGIAGLMWPEKFLPFFQVLMYPWAASYSTVRAHGVVALALSALLLAFLLTGPR